MQQTLEKNIGPAGLAWSGQSFRDAAGNLSRASGIRVAVLIDRRLDPDAKIALTVGDMPLADAIAKLAETGKGEACQVGPVAYLAPAATARRVRTLAELRREDLRKLPAAEAKRLQQVKPLRWEDFAEPRAIVQAIAAGAGAKIANPEAIPHDLWAAADLPAMSFAERMTLVAAAFDLTFEIEAANKNKSAADGGAAIRFIPMPADVSISKSYPVGVNAADVVKKLSAALPGAKIVAAGNRIEVEGRVEDHAQVAQALAGKPLRKPVTPGTVPLERQRIESFAAKNQQLGPLIRALAKRLQLEVELDEAAINAAGVKLDQLVTVEIKSGTALDLLKKITQPYGLEYELRGKKLTVRPAKPASAPEKSGGAT